MPEHLSLRVRITRSARDAMCFYKLLNGSGESASVRCDVCNTHNLGQLGHGNPCLRLKRSQSRPVPSAAACLIGWLADYLSGRLACQGNDHQNGGSSSSTASTGSKGGGTGRLRRRFRGRSARMVSQRTGDHSHCNDRLEQLIRSTPARTDERERALRTSSQTVQRRSAELPKSRREPSGRPTVASATHSQPSIGLRA